jgi:hypothetical protein
MHEREILETIRTLLHNDTDKLVHPSEDTEKLVQAFALALGWIDHRCEEVEARIENLEDKVFGGEQAP